MGNLQSVLDAARGIGLKAPDKPPAWHAMPRHTVRIAEKPMAKSLHFKNAAARRKAQAAIEAFAASKPKGYQLSKEDLGRIMHPFVNVVPVYRGALRSMAYATIDACITSEEKSNEQKQPVQK